MGINEAIIAVSNGVGPILGGIISQCMPLLVLTANSLS